MIKYKFQFYLPDKQDISHQKNPFHTVDGIFTTIVYDMWDELQLGIIPTSFEPFLKDVPKCWVTLTFDNPNMESQECLFQQQ